jgi:CRP/FNR family transcriptional regulator
MTFSSFLQIIQAGFMPLRKKILKSYYFPVSVVHRWLIKFPEINRLFYSEYDKRFIDLNMVNDAVFTGWIKEF